MKKRFIFDENYNKRNNKKDLLKWIMIGSCAFILVLILIFIIVKLADRNKKPTKPVTPNFVLKEELVIESGDSIPGVEDYFKTLDNIDVKSIQIIYPEDFEISYDTSFCSEEEINQINQENVSIDDFSCVVKSLKTSANYGITLKILEKEYTVNLIVQDTTAPALASKNVEIYVGESYQVDDFIQYCVDVSGECEIHFYDKDVDQNGNIIDYSKINTPGVHKIKIYASDLYGNVTDPIEAELVVNETVASIYIVSFDSKGGSAVDNIKVGDGNVVSEPKAPAKDGYQFAGWYLGNNKYDFNTPVKQNITLVAHWNKIGGGSVPPPPVDPGNINVSSISLDFLKINLYVGEAKVVKAKVYPSNATNKGVTWSSSDSSIAAVLNGKITGVKAGTATITATAGGKSASVTVIVREKSVASTCPFGDANYNTQYLLSVNLINQNCAVDPNRDYNEINDVVVRDAQKLNQDLANMGLSTKSDFYKYLKPSYAYVKNTSGLGLVGVQITITINVIDPDNPYVLMSAQYIIKPDGSRKILKNTIKKNGVSFQ